jgi:hypothetical protein
MRRPRTQFFSLFWWWYACMPAAAAFGLQAFRATPACKVAQLNSRPNLAHQSTTHVIQLDPTYFHHSFSTRKRRNFPLKKEKKEEKEIRILATLLAPAN